MTDQDNYVFDTEVAEQLLVNKIVEEGMVVFDVGAHIGDYSILLSQLVGSTGKVYTFEPTATTFETLKKRVDQYDCRNIILHQNAVFADEKEVLIREFPIGYSAWNSLGDPIMMEPEDPSKRVHIAQENWVQAISLDKFCGRNNISKIDFIKIDVEGVERDVLEGASTLLSNKALHYIQFEISKNMLDGVNRTAQDVFDLLISYGYQCHRILSDGELGESVTGSDAFYENFLAFPSLTNIPKLYSSLPEKLQSARRELKSSQQQVDSERDRLNAALNASCNELDATRGELVSLQALAGKLKVQVKDAEQQLEEQYSKLNELNTHLCFERSQLEIVRDQLEEHQKQLGKERLETSTLQQQLRDSENSLSRKQIQLREVREKLRLSQDNLTQKQTLIDNQKVHLTSLRDTVSAEKTKNIELSQSLSEASQSVKGLEEKIVEMESSKFWKLRTRWFQLKGLLGR
ncbi:MAG: FkbM family methyltransferase [Cyanobacteria bacterium P01_F01_bin.150]